jgi:hypothetical protein
MAMSGMRQVGVGMGFVQRTPPEAVLREGVPALLESVPPERRMAAIELAHWGYGAAAGTAFALLPRRVRRWRLSGPLFGVAVWSAYELAVAPALGLAHARKRRPQDRWAFLVDHLLFGFIVGTPPEAVVAGTGSAGDDTEEGCRGGRGGHDRRAGRGDRRGRGGHGNHGGHAEHCGHEDHGDGETRGDHGKRGKRHRS